MLARACAHQDRAAWALIAAALHDDLEHLAMPAARVAVQTSGNLGGLLAGALRDGPASAEVLVGIAEGLPYPSVVLARAHLAATLRESWPAFPRPVPRRRPGHGGITKLAPVRRAARRMRCR